MRKSLWSPDEDEKLRQYVAKHGCGNWSDVAKHTGLHRCGKSCRLRWINYLRPDLKRGPFTAHEVRLVVSLHNKLGNSWSKIATHLPGRTDNDVKNFWHSYTRSRRLAIQQQQRERMSGIGAQAEEYDNDDDEKLCYSAVYNHVASCKKNKEDKEHGYGAHHELRGPAHLMFLPNSTHINKEVGDCQVSSMIENINAPQFHCSKGNYQLPSFTSSKTNTARSNHVSTYTRAHLRPSPAEVKDNVAPIDTNAKPGMIHGRFGTDSERVIYEGLQSCITNNQICRGKLGSFASGLYPSTSSVEASSSAVSSTSHVNHDSTKQSNTQAMSAADDWSFISCPSMLAANDVINLQNVAEGAPEATFIQAANCINGGNSKPPEGLQSVIWRFFNQQHTDPAASFTSLHQDGQRAHTIHQYVPHHHHHQKPYTSIAVSSLALSAKSSNMQPPIDQQLPTADQIMNVEEVFSSYASCLQAQAVAADCVSY